MTLIAIRNGRVLDPSQNLDTVTDIFIKNDRIVSVGAPPNNTEIISKEIDAHSLWVCPGVIDLYTQPVHLNTENLKRIQKQAAAAGMTSLTCAPDTNPCLDNPIALHFLQSQSVTTTFLPLASLSQHALGQEISAMGLLREAGAIGFTEPRISKMNLRTWRHCYHYAAAHDQLIFVQAHVTELAEGGVVHEGVASTRLGLRGIPEIAETIAIAQHLLLIEESGVRAHFSQISSARSIELIAHAKQRGLPITCDVNHLHLHLTELDISHFDPLLHLLPPLRGLRDREQLLAGINAGVIDAICSGHHQYQPSDKFGPFADTKPGAKGLSTLLPLTLKLVSDRLITPSVAIRILTTNPARILKLKTGTLTVGAPADICLINPRVLSSITNDGLTPAWGTPISSQVMQTFKNGKSVWSAALSPA